ncbi:hypothetical protein [Flavobacterium sp.]|jgi:hypothetical protein|uniref:hypothetical protein n=1 Tax=Flavobacterium sp. TaxID=239 RepID=UPI0037C0AC4C
MKLKIVILFIAFQNFSFAQASLGYKKLPKDFCKVEHTCRAEYKKDDFENSTTYKIGFYETMLSKTGLTYIILKQVKENKEKRFSMIFFATKEGCITSKSYVHIQLKNGEKIKIPTSSPNIDCGTSSIIIDITNYIDILSAEPIDKIRIAIEYDDDFIVSEKGQTKFFKNLECIKKLDLDTK